MLENRVDTFPPSFQDSKSFTKILQKLTISLSNSQRPNQFTKQSITTYLNTFAFQTGFDIPTQQQINMIYYYLEDNNKNYITKTKFQGFLKKCISLYMEAKKQPIGGIMDRLILLIRNQSIKDKEKQIEYQI